MLTFNVLKVSQSRAKIDTFCQDGGFELTYYIETLISILSGDMLLDNGDQKWYFGFEIQMAASIPIQKVSASALVQLPLKVKSLRFLGVDLVNQLMELH